LEDAVARILSTILISALAVAALIGVVRWVNRVESKRITNPEYTCPDGYVLVSGWSFGPGVHCLPGVPATKVQR
jgi:hypothetical protein